MRRGSSSWRRATSNWKAQNMRHKVRIALWLIGGLAFAAVVVVSGLSAMLDKGLSGSWPWQRRTPIEYQIPDGYQGWVRVRWAVPGAIPLARSGSYLVVAVDAQGNAVTSSPVEDGWARDRYLYISGTHEQPIRETGWCKGGMIWASQFGFEYEPHVDNGKTVYRPTSTNVGEKFFVGPEELYRRTADPHNTIYKPCR
jgi:hypothetical protein